MFDGRLKQSNPSLHHLVSFSENVPGSRSSKHTFGEPAMILHPLKCAVCSSEVKLGGYKCGGCGCVVHLGCLPSATEQECIAGGVQKFKERAVQSHPAVLTRKGKKAAEQTTPKPSPNLALSISNPIATEAPPSRMTFLIHGWADDLDRWETIRHGLEEELGHPVHLFAYNSLDDKATIEHLSACFDVFIRERLNVLHKAREQNDWMSAKKKLWLEYRGLYAGTEWEEAELSSLEKVREGLEGFMEKLRGLQREATLSQLDGRAEKLVEYQARIRRKIIKIEKLINDRKEEALSEKVSQQVRCEVGKHLEEMLQKKENDEKAEKEQEEHEVEEDFNREEQQLALTKKQLDQLATLPSLKETGYALTAWLKENIPDTLSSESWGDFVKEVAVKVYPPFKGRGPLLKVLDDKGMELFWCSDPLSILPSEDSTLHYFIRYSPEVEGDEAPSSEKLMGLAFACNLDSTHFADTFFALPALPPETFSSTGDSDSDSSNNNSPISGVSPREEDNHNDKEEEKEKEKQREEREREQKEKRGISSSMPSLPPPPPGSRFQHFFEVKEKKDEDASTILNSLKFRRSQFAKTRAHSEPTNERHEHNEHNEHNHHAHTQIASLFPRKPPKGILSPSHLPSLLDKGSGFLHLPLKQAIEARKKESKEEEDRAIQKAKFIATESQLPPIKIDIVCYSTGGLILRYFLKQYYKKNYADTIEHIAMFAPANLGSPWAKKGKEGIGRVWVGDKSFENFLGCGARLLTGLECPSPFLWNLAQADSFTSKDNQYLTPEKIKVAVFQGTATYSGAKALTRGDMFGTDGTVTVTGASLRMVMLDLTLLGSKAEAPITHVSTPDVCFKIVPQYNHATITHSIANKEDMFVELCGFLLNTPDVSLFRKKQELFKESNAKYNGVVNVGKLTLWRYARPSSVELDISFAVISLESPHTVTFGKEFNLHSIQPIDAPEVLKGFGKAKAHSIDNSSVYLIIDMQMVHEKLEALSSHLHKGLGVVVHLAAKPEYSKLICSTAWENSFGNCLGPVDTAALFRID